MEEFEKYLLKLSNSSKIENQEINLDFREIENIDSISISLLYSMIEMLIKNGNKIYAILPNMPGASGGAISMLLRMGFFKALEHHGLIIIGYRAFDIARGPNIFQIFQSNEELNAFERALSAGSEPEGLLVGRHESDLFESGTFREILLHELGENAFIHGDGILVRMLLREIQPENFHPKSSFLKRFDKDGVLEFVFSDDGPGLIKTLEKNLPKNWSPQYYEGIKLSKGAKTCAYALEFYSTSNLDKRKKRIMAIFEKGADFAEAIPTGLYHVASIVKKYGGQIVFRTSKNNVSIDYGDPERPKIVENPIGKQGFDVKGTHIMIRVPKNAQPKSIQPKRLIPIENLENPDEVIKYLVLNEIWIKSEQNPSNFIIEVQKVMEEVLQKVPLLSQHSLVLIADGLTADTKTFSILLWLIGTIPHRGWKIILGGASGIYLKTSELQAKELAGQIHNPGSRQRLNDWQPFWIIGQFSSDSTYFSSTYTGEAAVSPYIKQYNYALKQCLADSINRSPVLHPAQKNRYYLIEEKYYTQSFYEIRQGISFERNATMAAIALSLFYSWINDFDIGLIVFISPPLEDFSIKLGQLFPHVKVMFSPDKQLKSLLPVRDAIANCLPKKCMIVSDVICTGRQFENVFKLIENPDSHFVSCFVDGRDFQYDYHTIPKGDRGHSIRVLSILKSKILFFDDLPRSEKPEIILIDSKTHAPTERVNLKQVDLSSEDLITKADEAQALLHGHICYNNRHYVDFVDLPRFFSYMANKIEEFWETVFNKLEEVKIKPNKVCVLYFSEGMPWEGLVPSYMATRGVASCRALNQDDLDSPPPPGKPLSEGDCMLFILPVIVTGETARKCLEYASRHVVQSQDPNVADSNPKIAISALISRLSPIDLSFYLGIEQFKRSRVFVSIYSSWPSSPHSLESNCSICELIRSIEINLNKLEASEAILELVQSSTSILKARKIGHTITDALNDETYGIGSGKNALMAKHDSLFRRGMFDINSRIKLTESLSKPDGKITFIEMLGSNFDKNVYSQQNIKEILYTHNQPLQEFAIDRIKNCKIEEISLHYLLGIYVLNPELLADNISTILSRAIDENDKLTLGNVLVLAAMDPESLGRRVAIACGITQNISEPYISKICGEIANSPSWFGKIAGGALKSFEELLWFLSRSTKWGTGIERLSAELRANDAMQYNCIGDVKRFERDISDSVLPIMLTFKIMGDRSGILNAIKTEGGDPDLIIQNIFSGVKKIRDSYETDEYPCNGDISKLLDELDRNGRMLIKDLQRLYTNARDLIAPCTGNHWYKSLIQHGVNVSFIIADDFPGILFGYGDLQSIPIAIFENAEDFIQCSSGVSLDSSENYWIEFVFKRPAPNSDNPVLEVRDNIPYPREIHPDGGLKQVEKLCCKYGARFEYLNPAPQDGNTKMRFVFRTDRSLRSNP